MGANSKIEWTDHTFNPWLGCSKVSRGCEHCYAERMSGRLRVRWGSDGERRKTKNWRDPVRWHNAAKKQNLSYRPRVFCGSLCDVFETDERIYPMRTELWELVERTDRLTWLLLTKRPQNILQCVPEAWHEGWPSHVWVGTSIEDQKAAERRLKYLCAVPAPIRFVSCEPLLGPVDLTAVRFTPYTEVDVLEGVCRNPSGAVELLQSIHVHKVDWVIVGGESGPKARPTHPDWVRKLREDCQAHQTHFFFKQWGEWAPDANWEDVPDEDAPRDTGSIMMPNDSGREVGMATLMRRVGKKSAGKTLDGREWTESPAVKS